jgi:phospholipid/cholesterol/gamma-HCH transport system substrate-binding protein
VLGAVVLLTAAVFLSFAYSSADIGKKEGYIVRADFDRIDGLKPGTDVKMNGVQVGSVDSVILNKQTYRATVSFTVDRAIKLPRDTIAMVASESLLGGKYLSLEVGVDDENVATDGSGRLTRTTPPIRLDDLIGHLIFNKEQEKKKEEGGAAPPPGQPGATPSPPPQGKVEIPTPSKPPQGVVQLPPPPPPAQMEVPEVPPPPQGMLDTLQPQDALQLPPPAPKPQARVLPKPQMQKASLRGSAARDEEQIQDESAE